MTALEFVVHGTPAPQGSKKGIPIYRGRGAARQFTGHTAIVESSAKVKPWREDVKNAALAARRAAQWEPLVGPVTVSILFTLRKPISAPKRRRTWPIKKPDLDKLIRSTLDALTSAGIYADDSQVVTLAASKHYPDDDDPAALGEPGARIFIRAGKD